MPLAVSGPLRQNTTSGKVRGIDLDSDIVIELAKECPNIVGIKLTYVLFIRFLEPRFSAYRASTDLLHGEIAVAT